MRLVPDACYGDGVVQSGGVDGPRSFGERREEVLRKKLAVLVVGALMALLLLAFAATASAAPPEPVDTTPFLVEDICPFPMEAQLSGKSKVKELPGGRILSTSPGLRVTLTNHEEPTNQVSYVITGSFLETERPDGNLFVVARGRYVVFGPEVGMFLTTGRFTFIAFDADGTPLALTRPTGNGRIVDVCAKLA
jgi:hypothetical protein